MTCACWPGEKQKETRKKDYEESNKTELERVDTRIRRCNLKCEARSDSTAAASFVKYAKRKKLAG